MSGNQSLSANFTPSFQYVHDSHIAANGHYIHPCSVFVVDQTQPHRGRTFCTNSESNLERAAVRDVEEAASLIIHDPGVYSRDEIIYPDHSSARLVGEGDRVGVPPPESGPFSAHKETFSLHGCAWFNPQRGENEILGSPSLF